MRKAPILLVIVLIFSLAPFLPPHQEDRVTPTTLRTDPTRSRLSYVVATPTLIVRDAVTNAYFVASESTGPYDEPGFEYWNGLSCVAAMTATGTFILGFDSVAYSKFVSSMGVDPKPIGQLPTVFTSFSSMRVGLPTYSSVIYYDLWPGIDLIFQATTEGLKYEYRLSHIADPGWIGLEVENQNVTITDNGKGLLINGIEDLGLKAWDSEGKEINVRFSVDGDMVGFEVLDRYSGGLTIDPLIYSTFLGGYNPDEIIDIAVDENGSAYVTGWTISSNFPTVPGSYDTTFNDKDTFVAKLAPDGSHLEYSTFFGLSGTTTVPYSLDLINGSVVIAGGTDNDIPTTANAFNTTFNGGSSDAFIMRLAPNGTTLEFSTFFGGSGDDFGHGVTVDDVGDIYVAGRTLSTNLPVTPGAFQPSKSYLEDAFVVKISSDGTVLINCTYYGGIAKDVAESIDVDENGTAYVVGWTGSSDLPVINAVKGTLGGDFDVFAFKLSSNGTTLDYSTYLGGEARDFGRDITVGENGTAHMTGRTKSSDFQITGDAFQADLNNDPGSEAYDAFYIQLHGNGSLAYSTFLGDSAYDEGFSIAIDENEYAYVSGVTESVDFPVVSGSYDVSYGGNEDAFLVVFTQNGSALLYGTFLGDTQDENACGVAVDENGTAYVAGYTESSNFPTTTGAFDESHNGGPRDGFVTVIENLTALGWPNIRILTTSLRLDLSEYFTTSAHVSDDRVGGAGVLWVNLTFDGLEYSMENTSTPQVWNWTASLLMNATEAGREILYNVWAGTVDGYSNSTPSYTTQVGTYPLLSNVSAQNTKTEDTTWRVTAVVTDSRPGDSGVAGVQVLFDGEYYNMVNESDVYTWSHLVTETGSFDWQIIATDVAGNINDSDTRTLRVTRAPGVGVVEADADEEEPAEQPQLPSAPDWLEQIGWYLFFAAMAGLALLSAWAYTSKATRPAHWRPFLGLSAMFVAIGVVVMGLMGAGSWVVVGLMWGLIGGSAYFVARFGEKRKILRNAVPIRLLGIIGFLAGASVTMALLGLGVVA